LISIVHPPSFSVSLVPPSANQLYFIEKAIVVPNCRNFLQFFY